MNTTLSYEQSVSQRFVTGIEGPELTQEFLDILKDFKLTSIILRGENIVETEQLRALISAIRNAVLKATDLEAFIFLLSDAESEQALQRVMTPIPNNLALASSGDEGNAFSAGRMLALELGSLGIDALIAPSLNINTNRMKREQGLLCFSDQVDVVSRFGNSMMQGLTGSAMVAVAHDFPGFGETYKGVNSSLRIQEKSFEELKNCELFPFESAMNQGLESLMCAPAYYQAFDSEQTISSMSQSLIHDYLREESGFDGVVLTPFIDLPQISDTIPIETAAVESAKAGCDLLLLSGSYAHAQKIITSIFDALSTGYMNGEEHTLSGERIHRMKEHHTADRKSADLSFSQEMHSSFTSSILERALTLVHSREGELSDIGQFPLFLSRKREEDEYTPSFAFWMAEKIGGEGVEFSSEIESQEINRMIEEASDNSAIIILIDAGYEDSSQLSLANALGATGIPTIAASTGNPYDLLYLQESIESVALFSDTRDAYEAFAKILMKERKATGSASIHW